MMVKKYFWIFHLLLLVNLSLALNYALAGEVKEKVIFRYKKSETIDLGELNVKGKNMAPTDLTVRERLRHNPNENIYEKKDFETEIKDDFNFLKRGGFL